MTDKAKYETIDTLETIYGLASNWTLDELNNEQDILKLRFVDYKELDINTDAMGPICNVFQKAFLLEITQLDSEFKYTMAFGWDGHQMIRTSDVVSYNPDLGQIKTHNSIYQVVYFEEEVFGHLNVWSHLTHLELTKAWPHRPQGLFF